MEIRQRRPTAALTPKPAEFTSRLVPARQIGVPRVRNLVVVLGDQLTTSSAAFAGFDPALDRVWMAEVAGESTYVLSHKVRNCDFLSRNAALRRRAYQERIRSNIAN